MKTTIKQIIATAILTTLGLLIIKGALHIAALTIDNVTTLTIVSLGLSIWIGGITLWLLARTLIILRDQPPSSKHRQMIFTDSELTARERTERLIAQDDTSHDLAHLYKHDEHQERLKRKYAIK